MQKKSCHHNTNKKIYQKPLYITLAVTTSLIIAALYLPILSPFLSSFIKFWHSIWWAIALGLLITGIIDALVPTKYISHYLANTDKSSIFNAAMLGFIMSACSHGILAISIELYKKGASIPSVITFLLASPWANLPVTLLLISMFGLKAFAFIISALLIAIITGFVYQFLVAQQFIEKNSNSVQSDATFSVSEDIKNRFEAFNWNRTSISKLSKAILHGSVQSAHMVLWWIIIGTIIGSLLDAYIPHSVFSGYLGPTFLGLILTLALATIIEVCSEGSAPIAFTIYKQTLGFGNAFVFLMAGVATDLTEIGLIWINMSRRAAILLPVITVPQILILGYIFNKIF